jgi:hypothetical protein
MIKALRATTTDIYLSSVREIRAGATEVLEETLTRSLQNSLQQKTENHNHQ